VGHLDGLGFNDYDLVPYYNLPQDSGLLSFLVFYWPHQLQSYIACIKGVFGFYGLIFSPPFYSILGPKLLNTEAKTLF
jgi:hypothetical protein